MDTLPSAIAEFSKLLDLAAASLPPLTNTGTHIDGHWSRKQIRGQQSSTLRPRPARPRSRDAWLCATRVGRDRALRGTRLERPGPGLAGLQPALAASDVACTAAAPGLDHPHRRRRSRDPRIRHDRLRAPSETTSEADRRARRDRIGSDVRPPTDSSLQPPRRLRP